MNDPDYDIELIERYFDQDLTSDERARFERRLQHDQEFKRLFDRERHVTGAIKFEGALRDLEYLRALEQGDLFRGSGYSINNNSHSDSQSRVRQLMPYIMSAAASLLIIAAVIFYVKPESPQRMASKYTEENLLYLSTTPVRRVG